MRHGTVGVSRDEGFGLAEVLVAMMLLLIVAVAMLPVYVSAIRLAATNVSLSTATQLVSEQMDVARGLAPTCDVLTVYANETVGMRVTDPQGTVLVIHRSVGSSCPTDYPAALIFTAWVTVEGDDATRIAEAETRIYIEAES